MNSYLDDLLLTLSPDDRIFFLNYGPSNASKDFQWTSFEEANVFILHKGFLSRLTQGQLVEVRAFRKIFANEVYVKLHRSTRAPLLGVLQRRFANDHWRSFYENVDKCLAAAGAATAGSEMLLNAEALKMMIKNLISQRSAPIYMGDSVLLALLADGHTKIFLDGRDRSVAPHIASQGIWENWITDSFRRVLKPGMRVVDVGANVGYYSLHAASVVGAAGYVTSIEANARLAKLISQSLMVNGYFERSRVINSAAWNNECLLNFKILRSYLGSSSIFMSTEVAALYHDEIEEVQVTGKRLENMGLGKVDYLKIDAEGAEAEILEGANDIILNQKPLIHLEIAPAFRGAEATKEMIENIVRGGYRSFIFGEDGHLIPAGVQELLGRSHCDALFAPNEREI